MAATAEPRLDADDHALVLEALVAAASAPDRDAWVRAALHGVATAVPADVVTLNEVDPANERVVFAADPADWAVPDDSGALLAQLQHEHPLIARYARTGDGSATAISDLVDERTWHASEIYRRVYAPMGVEDQLSVTLPARRPLVVAIVASRSVRGFSARDHAVLDLLRSHLAHSWRTVRERARMRSLLAVAGRAMVSEDSGIVVLGDPPTALTPGGLELLSRWYGAPSPGDSLPPHVVTWLAANRVAGDLEPIRPLVTRQGGRTAFLRYLPGAADQPEALVVRVRSGRPELEELASLGLTPRESQVLRAVASGAPNTDIATDLGISPGTVKKHLDNVYTKLGVGSRTQAIAVLLDIASHH